MSNFFILPKIAQIALKVTRVIGDHTVLWIVYTMSH